MAWHHARRDIEHDGCLLFVPERTDLLRGGRPRHRTPVVRWHVRAHREQVLVGVETNLEEHVIVLEAAVGFSVHDHLQERACRCVRGVHNTDPAPMPAPIVAHRSLSRKGGVRVARLCKPVDPLHGTDENSVMSCCRQISRWGLRWNGLVDDNKHLSNGPGSRCSVEVLHRRFAVQGALWGGKPGTGVFLLSVERTERQAPDSQQPFDTIRISTGETR